MLTLMCSDRMNMHFFFALENPVAAIRIADLEKVIIIGTVLQNDNYLH